MRFGLDEDQLQLQQSLRGFLEIHQPLSGVRTAMDDGYDRAIWNRLVSEIGVTAVGLPEDLGGTGESLLDQCVITAELGRGLDPGPYLPSMGMVAGILREVGGPEAEKWLQDLVEGSVTAAPAMDEAARASGPDGGLPSTWAAPDGDGWVVTGAKRFVLLGDCVDDWLVLAATPQGPTFLRVRADGAGVEVTRLDALDRTRPVADVTFAAARAELIGELGGATSPLAAATRRLRVLTAAEQVGGAERILEITTEYARTRTQFGRQIGSFQSIKHTLADAMLEIEAAKSAVLHAGWAFDHDEPGLEAVSLLCAAVAGEAYFGIAKAAIQVHGAIAFTWEHDAHLFLKRATTSRQLFGTPDQHREAIAALLLDGAAT